MPDRILIVTDAQEGFTRKGNMASATCEAAIPTIRKIVDEEMAAGTPIVFTKDSHVPNDAEFRVFPPHCVVYTPEHELVEELRDVEAKAAAVVHKTRYSAFFRTELESILVRLRPAEVHIMGFCTDICVLHTTADLRNRDFDVVVRAEGCETFDGPGHPQAEVNGWALAHIEHVLGARVE